MKGSHDYSRLPELHNSALIVGWDSDAGKLGESVTGYIVNKLEGHLFYEIEPTEYFPLNGVAIEDDLVLFPESKFYACPKYDLVVFKSAPPAFELYKFFNRILDIAENYGQVKEIYSVGGLVSLNSHIQPRQLIGTFSSQQVKDDLSSYNIDSDASYETAPGQKPALNSFLLWTIRRRNLIGVNLWIPVPFYLMSVNDPNSQKRILQFLNQRFNFGISLAEFDVAIEKQNAKIEKMRELYPDIGESLVRLESNLRLSEDENMKLEKQVEEYLKGEPDG
jgi:proteasome assembly chaperone (PAC2) family protein